MKIARALGDWQAAAREDLWAVAAIVYAAVLASAGQEESGSLSVSVMSRLRASLATPGMAHARIA